MAIPLTLTAILASALLLPGCDATVGGYKLVGSENCILCIRNMSTSRNKATTSKDAQSSQASPSTQAGDDEEVQIYGLNNVLPSRYGTFTKQQKGGSQLLLFNGKVLVNSMAPVGYRNLQDSPYGGFGSFISFDGDKHYQVGSYEIFPIFTSNGGNIQRRFPYLLIAIGEDKIPMVLGSNLMESQSAKYRVEGNSFIAEFDDTIAFFANGRFREQPKDLKNIPEALCREMYENRAQLAALIRKKEDLEGIGYVARRYLAFNEQNLYQAASKKKITYAEFKRQVCNFYRK
ncbi:hypothetical protein [Cardiobacterium valvarum]|nr:hypothetical protein [Cardiobacterium valvarum]